jgi:hypothetical protein
MAGNGGISKKLSYHQEKSIAALLSTKSIPEAASASGVSSRTLERWLAENEEFVAEYRAARRRVVEGAIGQLQHATTEAVKALERNLTCGKPAVEVRAALGILEHATKAVELYDLEERLSEIERRYEQNGKP